GIACEIVQPTSLDDELISSTRIRKLISEGNVAAARSMLTRPYRIRGMVVHGAGRGHELGFPTANLDAIDTLIPAMGVYAGLAMVAGQHRTAAIHVGPSPTFGVVRPQVEVHVMDFDDVMYGEVLEVDFLGQLRGVQQFDSVDEIKAQLARDVALARQIGLDYLQQTSHPDK
ncbi:MAG: riboflavin kinase, partial [Pirellulaceae bacterium]